jgi:predicted Zn-dependent peptidase
MTITTHVFPNGFKLIHERSKGHSVSSINVFCDVGSIYEPSNLRGASHFIEHMCFKGTTRVPLPNDIFLTYDRIGAYLNAYTEKRFTCYTVKCDNDYLENIIEMISDMMLNSTFNRKEYNKEENVVIEENVKSEDGAQNILFDNMTTMIYKGSSFENNVDMLKYHNTRFNYDEVVEYYKLFYKPSKMVFSITTSVPFSQIKRALIMSDYVKRVGSTDEIPSKYMITPCITQQTDMNLCMTKKNGSNTTHLGIAFRVDSTDKYKINLLTTILSGPMSSRLFRILREKHGLTYSSRIYTNYHKIYGDFTIYTETEHSNMMKSNKSKGVLPLIIEVLNDILLNGITKDELETAKKYIKGTMKIGSEDIDNLTSHNGESFLIHPSENVISYVKLYDAHYKNITMVDLNEVISKYIRFNAMSVSMVGTHLPTKKSVLDCCIKLNARS